MSLNLQHVHSLSLRDVASLPSYIDSLSIGPRFSCSCNNIIELLSVLPQHLAHLDLDLTSRPHDQSEAVAFLFDRIQLKSIHMRLSTESGFQALIENLKTARHLQRLDLSGNVITPSIMLSILTSLRYGAHLRQLNLSNTNLDDASLAQLAVWIFESQSHSLKYLDLSHNHSLTDVGFRFLARLLQSNPYLREINLVGCPLLSDNSALLLVDVLAHGNDRLLQCHLPSVQISSGLVDPIEYRLALNRAGRYLLQEDVPSAIWPHVIASSQHVSQIYYILSQKLDLLER